MSSPEASMVITLADGADPGRVLGELARRGLWGTRLDADPAGPQQLLCSAHSAGTTAAELRTIPGVRFVAAPRSGHPLVDAQGPVVLAGGISIGGGEPTWMCGPCSVESPEQIDGLAQRLAPLGVTFLRGGAFKPRSSPYAFPGAGREGLRWMRQAADRAGLRVVTEALSEADAGTVAEHADLVQVGSRNMQNYALLQAVGRTGKPVLLKRGMAATVEEWLLAGEHLLHHGASGVIFCERGVRGFDPSTRNLLDLGAVALLAHAHHLPVVVDPSHAAGRRDLIPALSGAALAAGAAGLLIEIHDDPGAARSDGPQALTTSELRQLRGGLR